jgi:hypothetical protein
LARTTRSRGSRGGMVWIRIVGSVERQQRESVGHLSPTPSPPEAPEAERGTCREPADGPPRSAPSDQRLLTSSPTAPASASADYPESCTTAHFEWRANKRLSTIYGRHPKGMDYTFGRSS